VTRKICKEVGLPTSGSRWERRGSDERRGTRSVGRADTCSPGWDTGAQGAHREGAGSRLTHHRLSWETASTMRRRSEAPTSAYRSTARGHRKEAADIILLKRACWCWSRACGKGGRNVRQHTEIHQDDRQFELRQCPFRCWWRAPSAVPADADRCSCWCRTCCTTSRRLRSRSTTWIPSCPVPATLAARRHRPLMIVFRGP